MWNRQEIKALGKEAWRRNKINCIVAAFIITMLTAGGGGAAGRGAANGQGSDGSFIDINGLPVKPDSESIIVTIIGLIVVVGIALLLDYFLINPIVFGARKFFLDNAEQNADLGRNNISCVFHIPDKKNIRGALFGTDIYLLLWTLLLIVPGIVKAYTWRLVPYLLAENPKMTGPEARAKSAELMYGSKWNAFVLDLSFIGWLILGAFTLGILNIIFTFPYIYATDVELYRALAGRKPVANIAATAAPEEIVTFEVTEGE